MTPEDDHPGLGEPPVRRPYFSRIYRPFRRAGKRLPVESPGLSSDSTPGLRERLSPGARGALDAAEEEARALGHRAVGTEHLLLALTRKADSDACRLMQRMGASPDRVRAEVWKAAVAGAVPTPGRPALTPRARLAVDLGHRAAIRIGAPYTGPEHLLIGLAAEGEGIAARALHKSGILARSAEQHAAALLDGKP
jgi:ATP-dependent Clp protease ATP-binding subunit ClpC